MWRRFWVHVLVSCLSFLSALASLRSGHPAHIRGWLLVSHLLRIRVFVAPHTFASGGLCTRAAVPCLTVSLPLQIRQMLDALLAMLRASSGTPEALYIMSDAQARGDEHGLGGAVSVSGQLEDKDKKRFGTSQDVCLVCDTLCMAMPPHIGGIDATVSKSDTHLLRTCQQLANAKKQKASSSGAQPTTRHYSYRSPPYCMGTVGAGPIYGNAMTYMVQSFRRTEVSACSSHPTHPTSSCPLEDLQHREVRCRVRRGLPRRSSQDNARRRRRPSRAVPYFLETVCETTDQQTTRMLHASSPSVIALTARGILRPIAGCRDLRWDG